MSFIGELNYERVPNKKSFFGRPVYRLTRPFGYKSVKTIMCEEGFETDFASIPWWIFFLRPKNGKWKKASVIHDKACIMASKYELTYIEADNIFYYAMLDDEASRFTASFIYFWVRLNHLVVGKG